MNSLTTSPHNEGFSTRGLQRSAHRPAACDCGTCVWLTSAACAWLVCAWLASASCAWAGPPSSSAPQQEQPASSPPRIINEAQLNYPEAALQEGLEGSVTVLVEVDANGGVTAVQFETGPEVFRTAARDAARTLRFEPARRNGTPIASITRVRFEFRAPETPQDIPVVEFLVHGTTPDLTDTRARTTLDEQTLEKSTGDDLATTLSQVAGVRRSGTAADSSKPIIRGQHERRLLVLNDGVRHESQKWGPDHATEIDPFSAGSISVIRGAAGARYGPDAIGGVILVEPPPMRDSAGIDGKVLTSYNTNGKRPYAAARIDVGSDHGLAARLEGNGAIGATQKAPEYYLGNTASKTWNVGGAVEYKWGGGTARFSVHHHDFVSGVFYGLSHGTPDEFLAQLAAERPVTADLWKSTYDIDRPYQDVTHTIGIMQTELDGDWGTVEAKYAFQVNLRQEYEHARRSTSSPQYDFTLRTHSVDTHYRHPTASLTIGDLEGGLGLQAGFQENVYQGWSLIPNYRSFSGGFFAYERLSLERFDVEAGARADALGRAAYLRDNDYDAHIRRETLDPSSCEQQGEKARCPADYGAFSFSLGTLVHVVPQRLDIKLDVSTATRFPAVDEAYMLGSAPTFPVFANGHPDLGTETILNGSLTTGLRTSAVEAEASVYAQRVDDYIYFAPELNAEGRPRFDVTIQGTYPTWGFRAIDAQFYGADGSLTVGPESAVGLHALGGMVRATDRDTGNHLIGTTADYLHLSLIGRIRSAGAVNNIEVNVNTDLVASQSHVEPGRDFAPPPPGYTLLGAGVTAEVGTRRPVRVGIDGTNLLDTAYREYTSLLRYYADQPGRDVRIRVGMDF